MSNESSGHPWSAWQGGLAHPGSPLGGGGPGRFRTPPAFSQGAPDNNTLHPGSPVGKFHGVGDGAQRLAQNRGRTPRPAAATQLPPATQPGIAHHIHQARAAQGTSPGRRVDVDVEILADGTGGGARPFQGLTRFNREGMTVSPPSYTTHTVHGRDVINRFTSDLTIGGTITIQTLYGPHARPTSPSQYGRGTTGADEQSGDTTVGFHESCHRDDFLQYLRAHPLPAFGGRVGMTEAQYGEAVTQFEQRIQQYFDDMDAASHSATDEVGYAQSTFDQNGPRPQSTSPPAGGQTP